MNNPDLVKAVAEEMAKCSMERVTKALATREPPPENAKEIEADRIITFINEWRTKHEH